MRKGLPQVSADSYIRAMSPAMWSLTLAAVLLLCLVLRAMVWLRSTVGMASGVQPDNTTLGHCALSVLGCICSQGNQCKVKHEGANSNTLDTKVGYNGAMRVIVIHFGTKSVKKCYFQCK